MPRSCVLDAQLEESQDPSSPMGKRKREDGDDAMKAEELDDDDAMEAEEVEDDEGTTGTPHSYAALAAVPVVGKTTPHADPGGRQRHRQEDYLPVPDNVVAQLKVTYGVF